MAKSPSVDRSAGEGSGIPCESAMDLLGLRFGRCHSRSEVLTTPCPVPADPGVYAWFFRAIPPGAGQRKGCPAVPDPELA